jgi:tripartite ATP-independent transporter DctM subunit
MLLSHVIAARRRYPVSREQFSLLEVFRALPAALLGLTAMLIILGGILSGVFTPTEAGAAAVAYVLVVGVLFTKKLGLDSMVAALYNTAITSAIIFMLMATAKVCAWLLTTAKIPDQVGRYLMSISTSPMFFITLVILLLVFLGFFIEAIAIMIMFVPVLAPIAAAYGIEAHHFGLVFVMAIQIALITPPVALSLFVTCKLAGIGIDDVWKEIVPFLVLLTGLTLLVAYWPGLSMWLPKLFGYVR